MSLRRIILAALLLALLLAPIWCRRLSAAAAPVGLTVSGVVAGDARLLVVRSAGRFQLQLDDVGVAAWCDLRYDPACSKSLVAPGRHLVEQREAGGALLSGAWRLVRASPVAATVEWSGTAAGAPFRRTYTIWAAGQVAMQVQSQLTLSATLNLSQDSLTGAALQGEAAAATLFLDAWTGEDRGALGIDPASGAIALKAGGGGASVSLPDSVGLRSPRFMISGWPGQNVSVSRGATPLVAGQDYLASWDAVGATLTVQALGIVPPGGAAEDRRFSFSSGQLDALSLSLGVAGRSLDPASGMLQVDGNMPSSANVLSTLDTFFIPYIQSGRDLTLSGAYSGGGAGIEFVLVGVGSQKVLGAAGQQLQATFSFPARGEYQVQGYIIDAGGSRLSATPDDTIATVGFGRVIAAIGDSITAGFNGDEVVAGDAAYPVTDYTRSPSYSADKRNIFQYNNNSSGPFHRGYEVSLNENLTSCTAGPVFILNDGYGGLRAGPGPNSGVNNQNYALAKRAYYASHIRQLGAGYVLLQLGTNDTADGATAATWSSNMQQLITGLQADTPGMRIWVARVPYISDPNVSQTRKNRIISYNAALPALVGATSSQANPVQEGPDFYTYFFNNQAQISADGLHPLQAGYEAMADLWGGQSVGGLPVVAGLPCAAMQAEPALPTPTPTPPTPTPPTTPTPGGANDANAVWLPLIRKP